MMKKLFVILSAIMFAVVFALPAGATDWDFYGSVRMQTFSEYQDESNPDNDKSQDSAFWFVQGQLLYDEVVGYGKPAIGAKFERMQSDNAYFNKDDAESDRVSVALNYFLKGYNAMISLCVDNVKYKDGAKDTIKAANKEDSITDYSLWFQFKF